MEIYNTYRAIITTVTKHYKKRTTDQKEAKFERNIIKKGGKCMA